METGDGLLVRFLPVAPIPIDAFIGLCLAARVRGNGIMEISARGSFQVRGLTPRSAPLFAAEIAELDIAVSEGVPVIADPLPDDLAALVDAGSLAAALRKAIAERNLKLAPKVSIIIDGGGRLDLDQLPADIRLRAVSTPDGAKLQLALAGDSQSATRLGTFNPDEAVEAVLALLARIAARGPEARASDLLVAQQAKSVAPKSQRVDVIGSHPIKGGGVAIGFGLALGQTHADSLAELARVAKSHGGAWARPAPGRALLLGPFDQANAVSITRAAETLGFVADARDPRRRIAACPGAPLCAHGFIQARVLAAEIAREVPLPAGNGIALHVSGCAKGCAHPEPAPLTVVGTEKGCGIVPNGTARDLPERTLQADALIAELRRTRAKRREAVHA
jgi:precorrin-3B synthase